MTITGGSIRVATALLCVATLLLAACDGQPATGEPTGDQSAQAALSVAATEPATGRYAFDGMPSSITGGLVSLQLENSGAELHELQLIRFDSGHSPDEVKRYFTDSQDGAPLPDWFHGAGGTGPVAAGRSTSASMILGEGQYAFLCVIADQNGVPHLQNGMFGSFEVRGGDPGAALPEAEATITAGEYSFDVPALQAGKQAIEFHNAGAQLHHAQMYPLAPGKTIEDARAFFMSEEPPAGPPPLEFNRGTGTAVIDGGASLIAEIDLAVGDYVLICFLPDRGGGLPHFAKGMLQAITVE